MKIDFVLTAGNFNHHYMQLFPLIHKVWKENFNLDCYLILVSTEIPDYLESLSKYIILFEPLENIHTVYIAQVIRILYPALFPDKTILITDLDILPGKKDYFLKPIEFLHSDTFVTYTDRYVHQEMCAICYNVAKGKIFGKMFDINTLEDIKNKLIEWYDKGYFGRKNCPGWYTDQKKLFEYFNKYDGLKIILEDNKIGFKRSHNRNHDKRRILNDFDDFLENIKTYSDIHCLKPYSKTNYYLKIIVDKLIEK